MKLTHINQGAGFNGTTDISNRTAWPIDGGSLNVDLHHPWTYFFVNLGFGAQTTDFNISLTQNLLNETGNGTICLPKLVIPPSSFTGVNITDGTVASIQVVTVGPEGTALYNV
jgi:hypothetical protein